MTEVELLNLLKSEIPISRQIGITDLSLENERLCLKVPLAPNVNHKHTMFGGSIYSVCAVSCYGLFLWGLRNFNISTNNIVISDGNIKYLKPVDRDAEIHANWQSDSEKDDFFRKLKLKGKAKTVMHAQVVSGGQLCAEFFGSFVAFRD